MSPRFETLFRHGQIGQMEVKNRIVMPAMLTNYGTNDGYVTNRLKDYYEARARGGTGLITVGASYVHPHGQVYPHQLAVCHDKFIPGLSDLAHVIQLHGAKVALQLQHGGKTAPARLTGTNPVTPSVVSSPAGMVSRQAAVDDISEIVASFTSAARRARQAGFDGVEIQATTGCLIGQFLSRASNRRSDAYGGDLQNRARFLVEVIRAIIQAVGPDYPIWCRLNGKEEDHIENGITIEDAQATAKIAQTSGAQAIHVWVGSSGAPIALAKRPLKSALLVSLAEEIKKMVDIPVITVGALNPEPGERVLKGKNADFIAIGKALIADPDLPNKIASGRLEDIVPCILCMRCIDTVVHTASPMECSVNAQLGREVEYALRNTEKPKRVVVVGGGPAGMETARVAALRGHQVLLCERENSLGGQLIHAAIPPHKDKITHLIKYLETQISKLGVDIRSGNDITSVLAEERKLDVVVVATGATPIIPDMPGTRGDNVATALEVLTRCKETGEKVVVVGGGMMGCETAAFLREHGKEVTILEALEEVASDMGPTLKPIMLERLRSIDIRIETSVKVVEITKYGVVGVRNGKSDFFEAQTIVLAVGMNSQRQLADNLKGKVKELYLVGDCVEPRRIREAIFEGFSIGQGL